MTIDQFEKRSPKSSDVGEIAAQLVAADERNEWGNVFDIASVRGGSFRLPLCDKVAKGKRFREERAIEPYGVWTYSVRDHCTSPSPTVSRNEISNGEWIRRGSVRFILDENNNFALPELTKFRPPMFALLQQIHALQPKSNCIRSAWDRSQDKRLQNVQNLITKWEEDERGRGRRWHGTAVNFNLEINKSPLESRSPNSRSLLK